MAPAPTPSDSGLNTPVEADLHPTAVRSDLPIFVESERTKYTDEYITSTFDYRGQTVVNDGQRLVVKPTLKTFEFQTLRKIPKLG